jgi:hypothetical protein
MDELGSFSNLIYEEQTHLAERYRWYRVSQWRIRRWYRSILSSNGFAPAREA